ncbi:MAG TPA: HipA domain-containing protein [Acidimicrobiales bacterium]|nr:HipA domain-containing protein [Acidimicrobiales bacterium]
MTADLTALRSVERAIVYKGDVAAASLVRIQDEIVFTYDRSYLEHGGPAVATTLPRSELDVTTRGGAVPPFFAGLLPEGRRLTALVNAVKTSADDELSLLLAVGGDAIGDVRIVPEGRSADAQQTAVDIDDVSKLRFEDIVHDVDRAALPGVQRKVSARMITLPTTTGRHILKVDPPEYAHLSENEAFFLRAARRCGLAAADAEVVHDRTGATGLLVTRFDRTETGERLAQEDACQLLARYPSAKYNVTSEDVIGAVRDVASAGPVAARDVLRQIVFAYLTCNGDAHAKNFSVVQVDGEWFVSPAYDVPSTYPYGDATMALPINGKKREDIGRDDVLELGRAGGLPDRATLRTIDDLVDRVDEWLGDLDTLPFDERTTHKWRRSVAYRRARLRP